ncbi:hypothetical protein P8C59_003643 [Phyllachora maydis]|uniref:Uncharacterized protein n=1 Tax=Phyllachora maydis TaxID=1825666 RepID=A0AAD9I1Z3_9PEZI|nr:hypothetical protein P8C59_003643 [Phyllachora maydis]
MADKPHPASWLWAKAQNEAAAEKDFDGSELRESDAGTNFIQSLEKRLKLSVFCSQTTWMRCRRSGSPELRTNVEFYGPT